jgi:hypothetical protein
MAVRLSALRTGRSLPPGRFLVLISVRGWVDPMITVRLKGLGQLKNPMISSGIESPIFLPYITLFLISHVFLSYPSVCLCYHHSSVVPTFYFKTVQAYFTQRSHYRRTSLVLLTAFWSVLPSCYLLRFGAFSPTFESFVSTSERRSLYTDWFLWLKYNLWLILNWILVLIFSVC